MITLFFVFYYAQNNASLIFAGLRGIGLTMPITMPIITYEVNPIPHCNRSLSSKYTMQNSNNFRSNSDRYNDWHCESYALFLGFLHL